MKKTILFKIVMGILLCTIISAAAYFAVATPRSSSPYSKLSVFSKVLSLIERHYVKNINEDELIYGAIRGMLKTIDPHSSFLDPKQFSILIEDTTGNFYGVGLEVSIRDEKMTVISPIADTPAEAAGIEPEDIILKIKDQFTKNMNLEDAVHLMRGPAGTAVTITIVRDGKKEPFDITLIRKVIKVQSVKAELIAPGYCRIWIKSFQDKTAADVKTAIEQMQLEGGKIKGIILDLRRNPGGLLEEAVRVSDLFLESGTIVSTKGRNERVQETWTAQKRGTYSDFPVIVLIDAGSASASEIVAGALQDHGRGLIVGTSSFGKGSVQSIIPVSNNCGLKLTIALYYTPSGKSIQATGILPDVVVESLNPPIPDEETLMMQKNPSEGELPGHLNNNKSDIKPPDQISEISDYQLKMAFQILRGIARSNKAKKIAEQTK